MRAARIVALVSVAAGIVACGSQPESPSATQSPTGPPATHSGSPSARGADSERRAATRADSGRPELDEASLIEIYRQVYCLQKKGYEKEIERVLSTRGLNGDEWMRASRAAVKRAKNDPQGFGKRWVEANRLPCP